MRTDYFDDLLPAGVTRVTHAKNDCVTPENNSVTRKNNELADASRMSRTSRTKNANTQHEAAITEHLAERAAIMEYDGGLSREQAEAEARRALRVYRYRLTDSPDSDLILIAPGCDLNEARASLRRRFGERLIDVKAYNPRATA